MKRILKIIGMFFKVAPPTIAAYFSWILKYSRHPERYPLEQRYAKLRAFSTRILGCFGMDLRIEGLEKLPKDTPILYVANHQSMIDPMFLFLISKTPVIFVAKKELAHAFLVGKLIRCIDAELLDRKDVKQAMKVVVTTYKKMQNEGCNAGIFPCGTRNKDPYHVDMSPMHPGSFKIATKAKAPIAVVTYFGTFHPLSSNENHRRRLVQMKIGRVIYPEEYEHMQTPEIAALAESVIVSDIQEMRQKDIAYSEAKEYKKKAPKWWLEEPIKNIL